uniref:Uncharacterized protein n=1 Tax=Cacopsylla melanoneura TaxID=428564 RepID=A0A8D8V696_9HEMI
MESSIKVSQESSTKASMESSTKVPQESSTTPSMESSTKPSVESNTSKVLKKEEEVKSKEKDSTSPVTLSEVSTKPNTSPPQKGTKRNLDEMMSSRPAGKEWFPYRKPGESPREESVKKTTPEKVDEKQEENVTKSKEDEEEDVDEEDKKDDKSKELSSVFEFDEALEDEMSVDIESESYLVKRKLAILGDSPIGASDPQQQVSKIQKMNELEKLKQKLFMDCSGESEELEEKGEEEVLEANEKQGKGLKKEEDGDRKAGQTEDSMKSLESDETLEEEEDEEVDSRLLCQETIPGSPTPYQDELNMIMELPPTASTSSGSRSSSSGSNNVNTVLDNTPPTTPDSSASLSPAHNECSTPGRDEGSSSTLFYNKILPSGGEASTEKKTSMSTSTMKRRSSTVEKGLKKRLKQSPRNTGPGSDSDELSLSESFNIFSPSTTDITKSKYSYFVELDPELDQAQRIAVVQQKLQDLRKEYMMYKQELVTIDRRRKKIRRREREMKKNEAINRASNPSTPAQPSVTSN